ncbi:conserved Plasmodium protein, unknown function [Plasmodium vivax]|uniref:Uncharacterized protein n=2 Tax=Plasmodium vivax TaxID=5855 RepID=A0A1G4H8C3_PLAVI|nr:hypothetical protein PVNG_04521 [Plasmodium vivax North Korean]SCO71160.1 conserved Plasmodium protein, unknown function [Plasmodium vivax]
MLVAQMSAPADHTQSSGGNNITTFVQWIDSILTSDILVNARFLRIEDEKGNKRKRQESLEEAAADKVRNAKRFRCENGENTSKTLEGDEEDRGNYHRGGNNQVASPPLYRNVKRSTQLYPLEPDESKMLFQADQENELIDRDRMLPRGKPPNDDSSSCDISEIESDEESDGGVAKSGGRDAQERSSLAVKKNYQQGGSEDGHIHVEVKGGVPGPFVYDITSSLMFYSSDEDAYDGEDGSGDEEKSVGEETSRRSNCVPFCLNYDQMEKNITTMKEMDDEFYKLSRQDHQQGESVKDRDDTRTTAPAVTAKVDGENNPPREDHMRSGGKTGTSSNDNSLAANREEGNNVGNSVNSVSGNNGNSSAANLKAKKQEESSQKNAAANFSFWNVAHETYVTRPLYAQHLKKEQVSLLEESEEMVKSFSVNKYSLKFVPRHLLYVVSQVASRTFFDPLYRKKLFRHY